MTIKSDPKDMTAITPLSENPQMADNKYLNLLTDYGFKTVFGNEKNKDILIRFINTLLKGSKIVKDIKFLDKEILGSGRHNRIGIVDILCEEITGERFILEMQRARQDFFKDRSIYYVSSYIHNRAPKGYVDGIPWNYQQEPIYYIGIMDFQFNDTDQENYRQIVKFCNVETGKIFYDKLTLIFLELPKFAKTEGITDDLELWMFLFRNLHKLKEVPDFLQNDPLFKRLLDIAEVSNMPEKEQKIYQQSLKEYWDEMAILNSAKKKSAEEGREEGREEAGQRDQQIVKALIQGGLSIEELAKKFSVTPEFIKTFKEILGLTS